MPEAPAFDLQCHSHVSDGALAPGEVVRCAAEAGVELLALTDHDTVDGVDEALAAADRHAIRLVSGVEVSAVHEEREDLHVLGYLVDHRDGTLLERLAAFRADRSARADRMAQALRDLGYAVDDEPLERRRAEGLPIGRPHLAAAVVGHRANAQRLREEGLCGASDFLAATLVPGAPAYRPRTFPTVPEAIELIHAAGGVAVWAHPFWNVDDRAEARRLIDAFSRLGLDGVEVFYTTHTREQTGVLHQRCSELGMLMTGSSDFHGPDHGRFGRFRSFELHGLEPHLGPLDGIAAR